MLMPSAQHHQLCSQPGRQKEPSRVIGNRPHLNVDERDVVDGSKALDGDAVLAVHAVLTVGAGDNSAGRLQVHKVKSPLYKY